MRGRPWSDQQDAELLRLLGEGYSSRAAARELGRPANSIIGRAHRLAKKSLQAANIVADWAARPGGCHEPRGGLRRDASRPVPMKACGSGPLEKVPAPLRPFVRLPKGQALDALGEIGRQEVTRAMRSAAFVAPREHATVRLEDLGDGCKWPLGDPLEASFGFCGASRVAGKSPYCPHHHAIAYTSAPARPPAQIDVRRVPSRGDRQFMGSLE